MTTPKTKDRHLPAINATVDRWMDDWIKEMAQQSGMTYSRILRALIASAHHGGFSPSRVTLAELHRQTKMRGAR